MTLGLQEMHGWSNGYIKAQVDTHAQAGTSAGEEDT